MLATNTIERHANFSREGIGKQGANKPFFLSTGLHKVRLYLLRAGTCLLSLSVSL